MRFGDGLESKRAALTACQSADYAACARALAESKRLGFEGSGCYDADSNEVRSWRPHKHASHTRLSPRR